MSRFKPMKKGANQRPLCECQEERAAIIEHDGQLSRDRAEEIARIQVRYCRDCPFLDRLYMNLDNL